ncbi:MAG: hypothetical protein L3J76_05010, partial [Candidatus Hydrothermae bacterium]|nr:hypothetical protein [Candidatus Hydrothermae bacterium]
VLHTESRNPRTLQVRKAHDLRLGMRCGKTMKKPSIPRYPGDVVRGSLSSSPGRRDIFLLTVAGRVQGEVFRIA